MKRGQFLAFIPSLFAVPLLGKEIIQEKERITIIKPEPVKIEKPSLINFDMTKCRVKLMYEDQEIGEGYLTNIHIENPLIDVSTHDHYGAYQSFPGPRSVEISAQLYNFHL